MCSVFKIKEYFQVKILFIILFIKKIAGILWLKNIAGILWL